MSISALPLNSAATLFDVFRETTVDADAMAEEYVRMYRELSGNGELARKKRAKLLE